MIFVFILKVYSKNMPNHAVVFIIRIEKLTIFILTSKKWASTWTSTWLG